MTFNVFPIHISYIHRSVTPSQLESIFAVALGGHFIEKLSMVTRINQVNRKSFKSACIMFKQFESPPNQAMILFAESIKTKTITWSYPSRHYLRSFEFRVQDHVDVNRY